ncbi:ERCC4 domain protein, partial [Ancylostoma caninum]
KCDEYFQEVESDSNVQHRTGNDEEAVTHSNIRNGSSSTRTPSSQELASENISYVYCQPSDQAEVVLIADVRENHGSMRGNTVVEYLTSSNHRMETRALSVGDYLWVLRKIDGTEMVLDWVVERKTWHDLQQSIRLGRYEEQKQRLCRSPMQNMVYLVEGKFTSEYAACEQALATTMVMHGFMIQRTKSPQETAEFLCRLTAHLKMATSKRHVTGISYESLQELSRKTRADTVKDVWIRQLMICPGMSSERAQQVADRFPSMAAMIQQYSQAERTQANSLLSSMVPGVNRTLSMQMSKFFSSVLPV